MAAAALSVSSGKTDSIAPVFSPTLGFKVVANFGQLPLKHAPPDEAYVSVHDAASARL